jgi:hypothetical protein
VDDPLRIDARRDGDGEVRGTHLCVREGRLVLEEETPEGRVARPVPAGGLLAVFARYAKPLASSAETEEAGLRVPLSRGRWGRLCLFRFRGFGCVHPSDYLVLQSEGEDPVAAPAPLIAGALRALAAAGPRSETR